MDTNLVTERSAAPVRARRDYGHLIVQAVGILLLVIVGIWLVVNLVKTPDIFCRALDRLGIHYTFSRRGLDVSIARRESVARLDSFVGKKS